MRDEDFIQRTFMLATKAQGLTWPNPLVGAVIVKNNQIIGEGYHLKAGTDHAEVVALKNCIESPVGATLYVNLEPCCHTDKLTAPCAQKVIESGISKVVISNLDPNPKVNGKGVELLRRHGIEVQTGILEQNGEKINEVFFYSQRNELAFVNLKIASSLDGKVALKNGQSQWITGESARLHVHKQRSIHQAILIGAQTLRSDNPKLNVRLPQYSGTQPKRIVFTKSGDLPFGANLFTDEEKHNTLIYSMRKVDLHFPSEQIKVVSSLKEAMSDLFKKRLINLYLEGGPRLAGNFINEGLVQRISYYLNPSFIGEGLNSIDGLLLKQLNQRPRLNHIESLWLDGDLYLTGKLCLPD